MPMHLKILFIKNFPYAVQRYERKYINLKFCWGFRLFFILKKKIAPIKTNCCSKILCAKFSIIHSEYCTQPLKPLFTVRSSKGFFINHVTRIKVKSKYKVSKFPASQESGIL